MRQVLENEYLKVSVEDHGAELVSVYDKENEREFEINLDFLKDGKTYRVTSFEDGINAGYQAMDYRMKSATMNKNQKLSIRMARNGGFAAVLE